MPLSPKGSDSTQTLEAVRILSHSGSHSQGHMLQLRLYCPFQGNSLGKLTGGTYFWLFFKFFNVALLAHEVFYKGLSHSITQDLTMPCVQKDAQKDTQTSAQMSGCREILNHFAIKKKRKKDKFCLFSYILGQRGRFDNLLSR